MAKPTLKKYLSVLLGTAFFAGVAQANLVTNGSFEGGSFTSNFQTLNAPSAAIGGWSVISNSVDWIHTSFWQASQGSYSLDMSGMGAGRIVSDSFSTVIGQTYLLTFDMAGNFANQTTSHAKGLMVSVNNGIQNILSDIFIYQSQYPDSYVTNPNAYMYPDMHWLGQSLQFTANSQTTKLIFTSLENNAYGAALDNVSVVAVNPPESNVPEPASLALLGLGLAGLGSLRRKK